MGWPMASDYAMMLQNSGVAFKDPELKKSSIKRDANGQPFGMAGAFAVVYKATLAGGGHRAVRAFTSARDGRGDSYRAISDYLARHKHISSLVEFQYAEKGIRGGDGKFYPLVTMEWVEGATLFDWTRRQCLGGGATPLRKAMDQWSQLVEELAAAEIAHGDLQHANVMVTNRDELKLVDYDCMCVPQLVGRPNLEIGVVPYQHPMRNETTLLSASLDHFSGIFIYVALRALAANPRLWSDYVERPNYDKLLIRKEDFELRKASPLFSAMRQSADGELGRMIDEMVDLYHADIAGVPHLRELMFSFDKVRSLLSQRMFCEAVELVSRNRTGRAAPVDLEPSLQEARKRVACLQQLKAKLQAADVVGAATLAASPLLQNYPAAAAALQEVRTASAAAQLLSSLAEAKKNNKWRDFVTHWDKADAAVRARPEAVRLQGEVETWRRRNAAWDAVVTESRKSPLDCPQLASAWKKLNDVGGHPEATPEKRAKIEHVLARFDAWTKWVRTPRDGGFATDEALKAAWNEKLFEKWGTAEAERPVFDQVVGRLQVVSELRALLAALPATPSAADDERVARTAERLPDGYVFPEAARVQASRERIKASLARESALKKFKRIVEAAESESAVVSAWTELQHAAAQDLADAALRERVKLAQQRIPLLQRLKALGNSHTADQLDRQLLGIWHATLNSCAEATPWKKAYEDAVRRKDLLREFGAALEREDDDRLAAITADPLLVGYPLPREWAAAAQAAAERTQRCSKLIAALQHDRRSEFREQFDQQILRRSGRQFEPYFELLRLWIREEILPCRHMGLGKQMGRASLTEERGVWNARWMWPAPRFCDSCLVGVCRHPPKPGDDPRNLPLVELAPVSRAMYEQASGRKILHALPEWNGCYVAVWAVIETGFESFVSEPFVLGRISGGPAAGQKAAGGKRNWGIL